MSRWPIFVVIWAIVTGYADAQCPQQNHLANGIQVWPQTTTILDLTTHVNDLAGWWIIQGGQPNYICRDPLPTDAGQVMLGRDFMLTIRHWTNRQIIAHESFDLVELIQPDASFFDVTYRYQPTKTGIESFPFTLMNQTGGTIVAQAIFELEVIKPVFHELFVSLDEGVSGTPPAGGTFLEGDQIQYSFEASVCNAVLTVYLDGLPVPSEGSFFMDEDRTLSAEIAPTDTTIVLYKTTHQGSGNFTPAVADLNQDGWPEAIGTMNDGTGLLLPVTAQAMGVGVLFAPERQHRDNRFADLNGDGFLDLVTNTYSPFDDTDSIAYLFWGNGSSSFVEDPVFTQLELTGFGETIVTADFDNDNDLDVFISYYTHGQVDDFPLAGDQCYLFLNDGAGQFTEIADAAGVSLRNRFIHLRPEGAQAVDFNLDGFIDLYVSGHFFINNGDLTFTDQRAALGLPELFDEGIKFLDWNNDGFLDLIIHHPQEGPSLFAFDGTQFALADVFPDEPYINSYGMNVYDLNNDGLEDVVFAGGGILCEPRIFVNSGLGFSKPDILGFCDLCSDLSAFGDFNRDGLIDLVHRTQFAEFSVFYNQTPNTNSVFTIEVLGASGERNQQGRVIRAWPVSSPGQKFTRVVDGGSGFMAQNQYPVLIGTPHAEQHQVEVFFADSSVNFTVLPSDHVRVYSSGVVQYSSD